MNALLEIQARNPHRTSCLCPIVTKRTVPKYVSKQLTAPRHSPGETVVETRRNDKTAKRIRAPLLACSDKARTARDPVLYRNSNRGFARELVAKEHNRETKRTGVAAIRNANGTPRLNPEIANDTRAASAGGLIVSRPWRHETLPFSAGCVAYPAYLRQTGLLGDDWTVHEQTCVRASARFRPLNAGPVTATVHGIHGIVKLHGRARNWATADETRVTFMASAGAVPRDANTKIAFREQCHRIPRSECVL